jgi:hypothetical protein
MATTSLVSVDQYLTTSYRPDCDYVDGVLLERNVGEFGNRDGMWKTEELRTENPDTAVPLAELFD